MKVNLFKHKNIKMDVFKERAFSTSFEILKAGLDRLEKALISLNGVDANEI